MRIIAGRLGGRNFTAPKGHRTRPMSDKVRGALFNTLGDIGGLTVLDAFAGSGALSYEAISRGAAQVVAIDSDKSAQRAIAENTRSLNLASRLKLISASANAWLSTSDQRFDIVICDPPYDDLQPQLLSKLTERVNTGGVFVVSLPPHAQINLPENLEKLAEKHYGDATLRFFRRT